MWPPSQWPIGWTLTGKIILVLFFFTFSSNRWNFLFWIYTVDPESSAWHPIYLAIFRTMKYSGAKNEIVIESARHPYEMHNEISRATFERSQWNIQDYIWKFCNEMLWVSIEKLQWNTQGYIWKTTMKAAEYWMKSRNEMCWVCNEK